MTNLIPAVQLVDGHPRVSSLSISEHFEKRHDNVIMGLWRNFHIFNLGLSRE